MRLLGIERFEDVFAPLSGRRIGVVDGWGNVGDLLLYESTRQLLREYGLRWQTFNPLADRATDVDMDVLLLFAGGSMGAAQARPAVVIREAAIASGIPCIVLPQSFLAPEDRPYEKVFVRERASLAFSPDAVLAPDLALGYDFPNVPAPSRDRGLFLRLRGDSAFPAMAKIDPACFCHTPAEYTAFAAQFEHVITDRLHLAITAMGIGRRVTLLPVAYHKNRSIWETWLADMGCEWAEHPSAA